MSKRKRTSAAKPVPSKRTTSKAQRVNQAIVKSSKLLDRVMASSASHSKDENLSSRASIEKTPVVVNKHGSDQRNVGKRFESAPAEPSTWAWAYQAKLMEITDANVQFAFEFAKRLATVETLFGNFKVVPEFTRKRIAMFEKHSIEIAELITKKF